VGTNHILVLDSQNRATAYTTQPNGAWPYWGNPFGACMYSDNRHVVVPAVLDSSGSTIGVALWDPSGPGVSQLLWQGPATGGPIENWSEWTMNSDGEIITIDSLAKAGQTASFLDPRTRTWRARVLPPATRSGGGLPFLAYNRLDGQIYWGAYGVPTEIYASTFDFASTRVIATGPLSKSVGRYGGGVAENGDIYIATCCTETYYVVKARSGTLSPGPAAASNVNYDLTVEHLAKPGVGLWGAIWNSPRGVQHIDPTTTPPTVTGIHTGGSTTMPASPLEVVELASNDLNTVRTGNRTWDVNVNPGQGLHAGKPFVVAVSITGAFRFSLADGRELFISPDDATRLSIAGQLSPLLSGNIGLLDGSGRAKATLDLTLLGLAANGSVIHLAALVLDPNAPSGVAHVCQPGAFVVNNR